MCSIAMRTAERLQYPITRVETSPALSSGKYCRTSSFHPKSSALSWRGCSTIGLFHPTTTSYTYRPDGLRATKKVDGTLTTKYLYDGQSLIAEKDGSGTLKVSYTNGPSGDWATRRRGEGATRN